MCVSMLGGEFNSAVGESGNRVCQHVTNIGSRPSASTAL